MFSCPKWLPIGLFLVPAAFVTAEEPKSLELKQTIPLKSDVGRYDHLALDDAHDRLFLANLSNNSLDIVDLKTGKLIRQIPDQKKIQGVAYAPDLDRIFVGNGEDGKCNVFDGRDYKLLKSIPVPDADNVRYRPTTHTIYVTGDEGLTAINAKTMTIAAKVRLPGPPEALQVDSDRHRLYVNTHQPSQVAVVDLRTHQVTAKYPLRSASANFPMALDLKGERIFVGCRRKPCIIVLDARSGDEIAVVPIPGDTDDLYFDSKNRRIYAICGEGFIAVLAERGRNEFKMVEKTRTARLARTGLFDAKKGNLYVIVPRQNQSVGPELQVYR